MRERRVFGVAPTALAAVGGFVLGSAPAKWVVKFAPDEPYPTGRRFITPSLD